MSNDQRDTIVFVRTLLILSVFVGCTSTKQSDTSVHAPAEFTPAWTVVESVDTNGAWLRAHVPNDETENVWLVGGQPTQGAIKVGNAIDGFESLSLPPDTPLLNWADGTSENMWVGGLYGTILHWNGSTWQDHSLDIQEAIWGLVVQDDTVVAVGGSSRWGGESAIAVVKETMETMDTEWTTLNIPSELGNLRNLFKVDFDGDKYWMVGTAGTAIYGHLDSLEAIPTGITQDLITVLRLPDGQVGIVGGRGTGVYMTGSNGVLSEATQLIAGINGIASNQSGDHLLVGELGFATFGETNEATWTDVPPSTTHILHAAAMHELNGSEFWYAVGGNLATADSTFEGSILTMEVHQ